MRKKVDYTSPKGWLTPVLVVITLLYGLVFGTWLVSSDRILKDNSKQVVGQLFAICAAYQIWFWPGVFSLTYKKSSFVLKLGGAGVIYFCTLWWWNGPKSPVLLSSVTVRQETSSFADTFERRLAELQAALLKASTNARSTADFEDAMNKAVDQARAEIERFRSSHKLTEAENRTLDNLIQRLPAGIQIAPNDSSGQLTEEITQIITNIYNTSTIPSRSVTNVPNHIVNTNIMGFRTNGVVEISVGVINGNQGIESNIIITIPTANLPEDTANPVYNNASSTPVMPSVVSNALVMNWDYLASKYPYGFNVQYQMLNFGPYNVATGQQFAFSLIRGRPELTSLPNGSGLVFLPTLIYMNYKFSKPVHMRQIAGQYRTDDGFRIRRPWHILPVTTYIESLGGQVFVIGNGPDDNWQSGLFNSIQPYFYQLDQYFPNGYYMVTADERELNIFKGVDPNNGALWSSTSVTKQQSGWLVAFPPDVVNGRELQTLAVPFQNQLVTLKIEGDHVTNTVGVIVYQLQSGPAFFMGIRNN